MNYIFRDLIHKTIEDYIDDILVNLNINTTIFLSLKLFSNTLSISTFWINLAIWSDDLQTPWIYHFH